MNSQNALIPVLPSPIETLAVAEPMSGRAGANRAKGRRSITADTDREALLAWLARFEGSPNTFASSRREAERLLLWSLIEAGKPLSSLAHEDLLRYRRFLADPQPSRRWVLTSGRKPPRAHPDWRPFAGPLSPASARLALTVVNSLFSWLVEAGYLEGNPLALTRRRGTQAQPRVIRFLDEELWDQVKQSIVAMPEETLREKAAKARTRWLFSLLFLCGLRISEVTGNSMGCFHARSDKKGLRIWWLSVTGKGGKTRLVPATSGLMAELTNYRRSLGLSPVPFEQENTPLLLPLGWRVSRAASGKAEMPHPLTRAALHGIVKAAFMAAAQRLEDAGDDRASRLRLASAHWLRHTAGSRMAAGVELSHVRDTLGHVSISTTGLYLHAEDDERHKAMEAHHRLIWS